MEESEKMTALKKAYAEIILNTAKEAAARIMVSERKAHQFQHDLSSTKDEALRILVRIKQTMESRIKEAEMKSLHQQRRIEELEAQLQEAEDVVSNLRVELNETHLKLDEMSKTVCGKAAQEVNVVPGTIFASEEKHLVGDVANGNCVTNNSVDDYGCTDVPDVPSIIMRTKKLELYRNGCTQRIRAYEGNLLNGQFSLPGELDDLRDKKTVREGEEGERLGETRGIISEIRCQVEDKPFEIKEVKNAVKTSLKDPSFIRRKKKRCARHRRSNSSTLKSFPPLMAKDALSNLSNPQTRLLSSYDSPESFEYEDKGKQSLSPSSTPPNVLEMRATDHPTDAQGMEELSKTRNCAEDEDREVASSLVLIRQQNGSGDCSDAPNSDPKVELKSVSTANLDVKDSETVDGFSSPPAKDRVLKYTFQRKRKKESLMSDNISSLEHDNSLKRKMGKKLNVDLELANSAAVESSRDSRRMAQVARQLISLSEKKWWK